jgi:hypothetical protein
MTSLPVAVVAAFEIGSPIIKPWLGGVKFGGISAGLVQAAPEMEVNKPIEQVQSTSMSMGTVNQLQTSNWCTAPVVVLVILGEAVGSIRSPDTRNISLAIPLGSHIHGAVRWAASRWAASRKSLGTWPSIS